MGGVGVVGDGGGALGGGAAPDLAHFPLTQMSAPSQSLLVLQGSPRQWFAQEHAASQSKTAAG